MVTKLSIELALSRTKATGTSDTTDDADDEVCITDEAIEDDWTVDELDNDNCEEAVLEEANDEDACVTDDATEDALDSDDSEDATLDDDELLPVCALQSTPFRRTLGLTEDGELTLNPTSTTAPVAN